MGQIFILAVFTIFRAGIISLENGIVALFPSTLQMLLGTVSQQRVRVGDFPPEVGVHLPDQSFQLSVGKVDLVLSSDKSVSCL